ncbi:MAG: phosphonate ABC transporter, permease protein PhnE [Lachnospiraceae bacterium]|nr:phosphonate ABC transporter, permease protein PhnE [Lachnospiraceae bacterium]
MKRNIRPSRQTPYIKKAAPFAALLIFILSGLFLEIDWGYFLQRSSHLGDLLPRFFPPDTSYLPPLLVPVLATLQMSFAGTALGCLLALLFAPFCSHAVAYPAWIRRPARFLIQILRSFPALILALACTFVFGLGSFSGTCALTIYTFAIMARLCYEDTETCNRGAYDALRSMGCGRYSACMHAYLPQFLPGFLANGLYMLESNVRQSAILGYVGAGGIGLLLNEKVSWREYDKAGAILVLLFFTVLLIEWISQTLSARILSAQRMTGSFKKGMLCLFTAAFVVSLAGIRPPDFSHTSLRIIQNMLGGLIRPELSFMLDPGKAGLLYLLLETVCISIIGTLLGALLAFPLALLNTRTLMPRPISLFFRLALVVIRCIPFVIYGLALTRVTGQGAFTGALTLCVCSIGLLAKRFTQAIDSMDMKAYQALKTMGIPLPVRIRHALLPQLFPALASAVLYRFDVNIREASILGLVGAGGIGAPLIFAMNHYDWPTAGALCIGLIILVWIIDLISSALRRQLA